MIFKKGSEELLPSTSFDDHLPKFFEYGVAFHCYNYSSNFSSRTGSKDGENASDLTRKNEKNCWFPYCRSLANSNHCSAFDSIQNLNVWEKNHTILKFSWLFKIAFCPQASPRVDWGQEYALARSILVFLGSRGNHRENYGRRTWFSPL